jgi:hypothetical protein
MDGIMGKAGKLVQGPQGWCSDVLANVLADVLRAVVVVIIRYEVRYCVIIRYGTFVPSRRRMELIGPQVEEARRVLHSNITSDFMKEGSVLIIIIYTTTVVLPQHCIMLLGIFSAWSTLSPCGTVLSTEFISFFSLQHVLGFSITSHPHSLRGFQSSSSVSDIIAASESKNPHTVSNL